MINWKKLPLRTVSFEILISQNKNHKGELKLIQYKGAFGFSRESGKDQFFKNKEELRTYLNTNLDQLINWAE